MIQGGTVESPSQSGLRKKETLTLDHGMLQEKSTTPVAAATVNLSPQQGLAQPILSYEQHLQLKIKELQEEKAKKQAAMAITAQTEAKNSPFSQGGVNERRVGQKSLRTQLQLDGFEKPILYPVVVQKVSEGPLFSHAQYRHYREATPGQEAHKAWLDK